MPSAFRRSLIFALALAPVGCREPDAPAAPPPTPTATPSETEAEAEVGRGVGSKGVDLVAHDGPQLDEPPEQSGRTGRAEAAGQLPHPPGVVEPIDRVEEVLGVVADPIVGVAQSRGQDVARHRLLTSRSGRVGWRRPGW
jgi:hypothetical protein